MTANQNLNNFISRSAAEDDVLSLSVLDHEVQKSPWNESSFLSEVIHPDSKNILVIEPDSKKIVGYFFARFHELEGEIMTIGIKSGMQKNGLGRLLLNLGLERLKELGAKTIYLEVSHLNLSAQSLYKSVGFVLTTTRKAYYSDGSDALCMRLDIANPT